MTRNNREAMIQMAMGACFLLCFYGIFTLLQKDRIFSSTLGKFTTTYERLDSTWKISNVSKPYRKISESNLVIWDVAGYQYLKENIPSERDVKSSYGFFPMFPWIWKLTMLPVQYIGIFNFFLFAITVVILIRLFPDREVLSTGDRLLLFLLALSVPSVIIYLMPYSEAVFAITFTLAIWGLFKRRYWIYFLFMTLAAMSRASVVIVIASIVASDVILLYYHRNLKHFLKEVSLKIFPLVAGMFLVFTYHYMYSGNFFKYYEVQSTYWTNNLQYPTGLADWSIEGFGMNIATIFLVVLPGLIFFFSSLNKELMAFSHREPGMSRNKSSIFTGDARWIKEYFFLNAIVFFTGFYLYVLLFRGGSIHCLHRFIVSSPYFFIFFLLIPEKTGSFRWQTLLLFLAPLLIHGLYLVRTYMYPIGYDFKDSGFFIFILIMSLVLFMKRVPVSLRWGGAIVIAGYALLWLTFLYNQYLSNAWIFA